jgi:hypothetical protein
MAETTDPVIVALQTKVTALEHSLNHEIINRKAIVAEILAEFEEVTISGGVISIAGESGIVTIDEAQDALNLPPNTIGDIASQNASLSAHIGDASAAHAASAIAFTPAGGIAATDAQAAIVEAKTDAVAAADAADVVVAAAAAAAYVPKSLADTKGDLWVASAADTPARLAAGANGSLLVPDSAESTGLKYTTTLFLEGTGSPEGVQTAPIGSSYRDTNDSSGFPWWLKASGVGNTGWLPAGYRQPFAMLEATAGTNLDASWRKINLASTAHIDEDFFSTEASFVTCLQDGWYDVDGWVGINGGSSDRYAGIGIDGVVDIQGQVGVQMATNQSWLAARPGFMGKFYPAGTEFRLAAVCASGPATYHDSVLFSHMTVRKVG